MTQLTEPTDQRLAKGARARATIAQRAAELASVEGLDGLSIGRLAADLGLSKSGIATLFGTKEALQLAAVQTGRDIFVERVIAPSLAVPRGIERIRALVDRWFAHIDEPPFPGGCFRVATLTEFSSKTGPVHDAVVADHDQWLAFLAAEIAKARELGALPMVDPDLLAFELDAIVSAANVARQTGDSSRVDAARAIAARLLSAQG
ncbi:TetR/AcrR family transcriptional regulator [Nocardia mangyaensis]|uniref:TetR/AcrR family transcriptional regulator n=1 Tax=Nocardia mangyaensis TaxID=2213200 RepID=UPI002674B822|nr:TetR family transcriptional regulator [Nocardia mangyaensis]MDO3648542.1 TetR family transcriptional regulator [Nocardia mangyaensis]